LRRERERHQTTPASLNWSFDTVKNIQKTLAREWARIERTTNYTYSTKFFSCLSPFLCSSLPCRFLLHCSFVPCCCLTLRLSLSVYVAGPPLQAPIHSFLAPRLLTHWSSCHRCCCETARYTLSLAQSAPTRVPAHSLEFLPWSASSGVHLPLSV
jgi:hypothetical protein